MIRKFFDPSLNQSGGGDTSLKQATEAVIAMKKAQEEFLTTQKAATEKAEQEKANLKAELKETRENLDKVIKAQDTLIAEGQRMQTSAQSNTPFADQIGKALSEKETMLKAYREGNGKGFTVTMDRKVMTSAGNTTGSYFVPPTVVPGVILLPYEEVHLRNILPVGQTNSNTIRYIRDMGRVGAPTMVAEGATKPELQANLQIFDAPVRKIAVYMRVPEEMMDDIPYLQSFLTQIGIEEVMLVEDDQILNGNGVGQNLSGLIPNATPFNPAGLVPVQDPNMFDVLRAARAQARLLKRRPTVALINPGDYYKMTSEKDSTNNYLFLGGGNGINPGRNVDGLTIIDHTEIEPGEFLVMDPRAAAIFDRTGLSVRFYDQDQDNAIKNLITIVIEKRLALPIYYQTGLIAGNFDDAIGDLAVAS